MLIVAGGIVGSTSFNSIVANVSLFSIIKNVLNRIPTKELYPPISGWMILSTFIVMATWNALLAVSDFHLGSPMHYVTLSTTTWFLNSIGYGFCALVIGVVSNFIVQQSSPGKNNEEIRNTLQIYDKLCSFAGPHLFITLTISTIRTTLAIFGTINVTQCLGSKYLPLAVSYFCMMIMDAHIVMYYCLTLHKCQNHFKGMTTDLRYIQSNIKT